MAHTLHISFLPFLDRAPFVHSIPSTPYPLETSPALDSPTESSGVDPAVSTPLPRESEFEFEPEPEPEAEPKPIHEPLAPIRHRAVSEPGGWPIFQLYSYFTRMTNPLALLSNLTTIQLKFHTRLQFNEQGRITSHEDTWGIKELVEGVFPIAAGLYGFNRRLVGSVAAVTGSVLFRRWRSGRGAGSKAAAEEEARHSRSRRASAAWGAAGGVERGQGTGADLRKMSAEEMSLTGGGVFGVGSPIHSPKVKRDSPSHRTARGPGEFVVEGDGASLGLSLGPIQDD